MSQNFTILYPDVRLNIALNVNENPLTPQVGNFNWINLARSFIKYYVQVSIPYNCAWTGKNQNTTCTACKYKCPYFSCRQTNTKLNQLGATLMNTCHAME